MHDTESEQGRRQRNGGQGGVQNISNKRTNIMPCNLLDWLDYRAHMAWCLSIDHGDYDLNLTGGSQFKFKSSNCTTT